MLSSPLLVTWKKKPLALGPRLNVLLEIVVIRVLNQVAHVNKFKKINQSFWLCQDSVRIEFLFHPSEDEEIVVPNGGDLIGGNQDTQKSGSYIKPSESYNTGFTSSRVPSLLSFFKAIPSLLQIPLTMASKVITLDELREHTTKEDIWVLLHGKGQFLPLSCRSV